MEEREEYTKIKNPKQQFFTPEFVFFRSFYDIDNDRLILLLDPKTMRS